MAATKMLATFTTLISFKNKYCLNEEVFPLLCPPYIPDMYVSVLNKPTLSTALKLYFGPRIVPLSVSVDVEDLNMVTPRKGWSLSQ